MKTPIPRRLGWAALQLGLFTAALPATFAAELNWIQTARVFLIDAYQPPFAPKLEYDAEALARTMVEMRANTVRISTMGKYATTPGVRFPTHPDLGARDVLAETITARKPRGIRTVAYISTGPFSCDTCSRLTASHQPPWTCRTLQLPTCWLFWIIWNKSGITKHAVATPV